MNHLPLFYYPNKWIFVDDDQMLLDTVKEVFGGQNRIDTFRSVKECLLSLYSYQPPLKKYNFSSSNVEDEAYGSLQRIPGNFDITCIAEKLANDPSRHNEITVLVLDYEMPGMNGLTLAKLVSNNSIKKILLTGKAQSDLPLEGLSKNLINKFLQKSDHEMGDKLINYLNELTFKYFQEASSNFLTHLETEAKIALSDQIFIEFFKDYCEKNKIIEFYIIDKQGSFLCIDDLGKKTCLVVQSEGSIDEWIKLHSDSVPENILNIIRTRQKISFFGIGKEAWQADQLQWEDHLYVPNILDGREKYFWTTIDICS